jgi:hypothetical protein
MVEILKPYFEQRPATEDLTYEERSSLTVAYKNAVGHKRIAWRATKKALGTTKFSAYRTEIAEYLKRLEDELVDLCKDLLGLITKVLYP